MRQHNKKINWVSSAICRVKGHDFQFIRYQLLSNEDCEEITECRRCGLFATNVTPHKIFQTTIYFKSSGNDCIKTADCKKCGEHIQLGIQEHDISVSEIYFRPSNTDCVTMRKCKNCGALIKFGILEHDISGSDVYFRPSGNDCARMANCKNCNGSVTLEVQEHKEKTVDMPCQKVMRCENCTNSRVIVIFEEGHQYKFVSSTQVGDRVFDGLVDEWVCDYDNEYKCEYCGKTKIERDSWKDRPGHLQALKEMSGKG